MTKEELLKATPTRQLMSWRESAYRTGSVNNGGGVHLSIEDVLGELNTREHVPNKMEAKAIRRARAKQGR